MRSKNGMFCEGKRNPPVIFFFNNFLTTRNFVTKFKFLAHGMFVTGEN